MADTYTSSLRLQQPTIGGDAATWGGFLNTDLVLIDNAINGVATINLAGLSSFTLTVGNGTVDQARNLVYNFTGALSGDCTVTLPQSVKFGYAVNSTTGGHRVILTTGTGGTNLNLPTAAWYQFFYCDSSNVFSPSIGYAYANFLNDVGITGALSVTGTTTLAGNLNGQAIAGTTIAGSTSVACGSWFVNTNGDQHIPYLGGNMTLSSFLNQSVTNTASPIFADVGISGLGFIKASYLNQGVKTTSSPTFANVGITGLGTLYGGILNQAVLSSSNPTFNNVWVSSLGDWITNFVNQRVRTVDSPTFANVGITGLGFLTGLLNQSVKTDSSPTFNGLLTNGSPTFKGAVFAQGNGSASFGGWNMFSGGTGATGGGAISYSIFASFAIVSNTIVVAASDARLKTEVETIDGDTAERFVTGNRPVRYLKSGVRGAGFIAQEVLHAGFGEMVHSAPNAELAEHTDENGITSPAGIGLYIDYDQTSAYHHAALQRLFGRIEALEARVEELEEAMG